MVFARRVPEMTVCVAFGASALTCVFVTFLYVPRTHSFCMFFVTASLVTLFCNAFTHASSDDFSIFGDAYIS